MNVIICFLIFVYQFQRSNLRSKVFVRIFSVPSFNLRVLTVVFLARLP